MVLRVCAPDPSSLLLSILPFERAVTAFGAMACGAPESLAPCTNCFTTRAMCDGEAPSISARCFVEELPRPLKGEGLSYPHPMVSPGNWIPSVGYLVYIQEAKRRGRQCADSEPNVTSSP